MSGLQLARQAVWFMLEEVPAKVALAELAAGWRDLDAARMASDYLGFTSVAASGRAQVGAYFLVNDLRTALERTSRPVRSRFRRPARPARRR